MQAHPGGARRTRQIKACCGNCAYTVRVSRKWLIDVGPPLCPNLSCSASPMKLPEWDPVTEWRNDGLDDAMPTARILTDKWVDTRTCHTCEGCGRECERGERMRHRVYRADGALQSNYTCFSCDTGGRDGRRAYVAEQASTDAFAREARG